MAEFLNGETFAPYLASSKLPVLADFYRDGCVPCRRIAPLLSKLGTDYAGRLNIVRVNVGQNPKLAEQYRIEAAPTLLLFRDGEEHFRHRGIIDRLALEKAIQTVL